MPTKDYYESSASLAAPRGKRSSGPIARSRASIIPTSRTTSRRPSTASRRSTRRTRCSQIRTSARTTIVSAPSATARRAAADFGFGGGRFGDIFDMFFGNARGARARAQSGPERGADLRYDIEISLEEAFTRNDQRDRLRPARRRATPAKAAAPSPGR